MQRPGACRGTPNPAIFTAANLAQYDAIFFWQASSRDRDDTTGERLFTDAQQAAIEQFARGGGGIGAMHASVTMGAGQVTWPWWDAPGDSAIGALMPGHSATDANNIATVQVSDRNHPSTKDLPDSYRFGDEHYTFSSNVRGTHHVLMTLDEETYNVGTGVTRMGADHPIAWCRMYEGARIWASSLGHFSAAYLENGGDNNLIKHLVGGVRYVAGTAGKDSDCGATVWTNFRRTVLADDLKGAIGLDIARDGKVYWTEIGDQAIQSEGRLRMYDPQTRATSTLLTLQTRADHQSSNDGVLGMALDPNFATNRHLYVYYSPRQDPGCNSCLIVGHNLISRFTLNAAGTAVVAGSEQEVLRVPKVKVGNNNQDGVAGQTTYSAHVGGGSISFDSNGDLYIGTGDDVDPFGQGGNNYAPLDQRYPQRYDARNTPRTRTTCAARSSGSIRCPTAGPAAATRSRPGTCSRPARRTRSPRSTRWASATRSRSRPTRSIRARSWSASTAPTRRQQQRHARPGRRDRVGPRHQARLLRLAAVRGRQLGRQQLLPLHVPERPVRHALRLLGDGDPERVAEQHRPADHPRPGRRRRRVAQAHRRASGAVRDPGPVGAAGVGHRTDLQLRRLEPVRRPSGRRTTTAPGSSSTAPRTGGARRASRTTAAAILRVNGLFGSSQFGNPGHSYPIPVKFGPDGALYMATWGFDCCRAQLPTSSNGRLMRVDFIADEVDTTAPVVDATVAGTRNGAGDYLGRATLTLTASDSSGVARTEYSTDGGQNWTRTPRPSRSPRAARTPCSTARPTARTTPPRSSP